MKTKKRAGDKSSHSWASPSHRRPHQEPLPSKSSPTPPQKTASRRGWSSRDQTRNLTAATLQTAKLHTPDLPTHLLDEIPRLPSTSRCQKGNRRRRGATDSPAGTRTPPPTSRPSQNSNLIASGLESQQLGRRRTGRGARGLGERMRSDWARRLGFRSTDLVFYMAGAERPKIPLRVEIHCLTQMCTDRDPAAVADRRVRAMLGPRRSLMRVDNSQFMAFARALLPEMDG
jgi:hypothetical protein